MKRVLFYFASIGASASIPFIVSYFYTLDKLGEFYYLLTLANIVSSICLCGSALYYSSRQSVESNFVARALVGSLLVSMLSSSYVVFFMCIIAAVEKFSTQVSYQPENKVNFVPLLQLSSLVTVTILCLLNERVEIVALGRTIPFAIYIAIHRHLYLEALQKKLAPDKSEIALSFTETIAILLDSGVVAGSYSLFSAYTAGIAGFARTCCSFGYVFYNWTMLNLRNIHLYAKYSKITYLIMVTVAVLIYALRFQSISFVSISFILYFCFVPTLIIELNASIKQRISN